MMSDRFMPLEREDSTYDRPRWGVWDSVKDDWGRITFGGEHAHEMAIGCAAQWNHMVTVAETEPTWHGKPIPHYMPPGEKELHDQSRMCACNPQLETAAIPGIGGGAWYQHRSLVPDAESIPDTFPEHW